ncbi:DNA polymerase ligase N-terminal domain-containing protein [Actinoplanes subtropicus]|uniref:DNA polymerase ligase N-terminal domain-containing protein n=1 Tax=Actinoplanes subtropicus TaxID=543632 RepID=UPI0004C32850|nr:DNA polymerase ligase N-terminal domain-containing protein [Actinoplanes subtropicus]
MASADPLGRYRDKRDFARTPEPAGAGGGETATRRFVVQRHRARRLHYDFRLEVGGVLASWAVPKGPTLDPKVRRAAYHVEDHPLDYAGFEGVIPGGQYGSGDVIVWDNGTWQPASAADPDASLAAGELHFDLFGAKLRGRFVLVRTRVDARGKEEWLLLHKRDQFAVSGWDPEEHPRSVLSDRTNDEVQADPDRAS